MTKIIGVRFGKAGKAYYFDTSGLSLKVGDEVVVETAHGAEIGIVSTPERETENEDPENPYKPVIRKATEKDLQDAQESKQREAEAFETCQQKIEKLGLDMKLINVEYAFDGSKIIFYFTADGRVDFRELVKELAGVFKTRIELRQIGVRDEAKLIGGLGPCGRPVCCSVFLGDFSPVSIKMAKEQNLSLSPTKISGLCGRLMCCLNFENDYYEEVRRILPKNGMDVKTPDGEGIVADSNPLTQKVKVKLSLPDGSIDLREYDNADLKVLKKKKNNDEKKSDEKKHEDRHHEEKKSDNKHSK
ncbi:MAG: stage 0 sporulation family protein [Christensenellaceae bacterium]|nr:stage 0 sporulation family protein [Christensenellaceae bacterium]